MIVAERDGMVLRFARIEDFPKIDEITIICYTAIAESWIEMQSEEIAEALRDPSMTWQERKNNTGSRPD